MGGIVRARNEIPELSSRTSAAQSTHERINEKRKGHHHEDDDEERGHQGDDGREGGRLEQQLESQLAGSEGQHGSQGWSADLREESFDDLRLDRLGTTS